MKKQIVTFAIALLSMSAMAQTPFDVQTINVTQSSPKKSTGMRATAKNAKISQLPSSNNGNSNKPSYNGIVTRSTNAKDLLYYKIVNDQAGEVSVTKEVRSNNLKGRIVVPETIKYKGRTYKVVRIDKQAFENCKDITTIEVQGDAMTSVGSSAFKNCTSLTTVVLNRKCKSISRNIFEGCTKTVNLLTYASVDNNYFEKARVIVTKRNQ